MRKNYFTLVLVFVFLFLASQNYAQTKANVTINNIEETDEGMLIVKYSLDNYKSNELFDVNLEVKKGDSNLNVTSVTGDIGENIEGGNQKTIEWDLLKDNIVLDEYVDVQLVVDAHEDISRLTMTQLFVSSTFLPGAGLRRLNQKGSYKIMGYVGYTLLATTALSYYMTTNYYNKYTNEITDLNLRTDYYSKTAMFRNFTYFSILGATTIWLGDYLWLYLKKKNLDKNYTVFNSQTRFKIGTSYNALASKPMLNLQWYF